jgi:DNA-binding response OmpR family regulator
MMPLVFVVDGVTERRCVVQYALEQAGYSVETFATTRALEAAEQQFPPAIIVASKLPDGSGVEFCRRIRSHAVLSPTAVVLIADNKIDKQNVAIDSGADACLSFPLAPGELVSMVESVLRRARESSMRSSAAGDIFIDSSAMKITVRGKEITTTILEFRLIDYMARHHGKVFTRDALLDAVWGDLQFVTPRSVDACIRRIRKKLEPDCSTPTFLKTIRGIGYKLEAKPVWARSNEVCHCALCTATRARLSAASLNRPPQSSGGAERSATRR